MKEKYYKPCLKIMYLKKKRRVLFEHKNILISAIKSTTICPKTQQAQINAHSRTKSSFAPRHGAPSSQRCWVYLSTLFIKTSFVVTSNPKRDNSSSFLSIKSFGCLCRLLLEVLSPLLQKGCNVPYKSINDKDKSSS